MTDSLTIKDLNCGTCDFGKTGIRVLYPNGELKTRLIKCQKLNRALLHEESDIITQTGCCLHQLALQVLAQPVIAELERRRKGNPTSAYVEGMFDGYDEALELLNGEKQ